MKYYRKTAYLFLSIVFAISLQGCDWVKGQLGMPTSEDIARMKEEIRINEEQKAAIAQREQFVRDSLAKAKAQQEKETVTGYHVVVGCFKDYTNAAKLEKSLEAKGYADAMQIPLKNGYMMVTLGGMEKLGEAVKLMNKVSEASDIPYFEEVWVYNASHKLHKEKQN
jgi:hypothetical protein